MPLSTRNIAARALLGVLSAFFLIPAAVAVAGGFLPTVSTIGPFGTVLNKGLPYVLGAAAIATLSAGMALVLGGQKVGLLLALAFATLLGAGVIGYRYASVAAAHGARYDIVRALEGFPAHSGPDQRVVYATVDGHDLKADLWVPATAANSGERALRAVVFIHGGSFIAGTTGTRPLLMASLRDAGIVAIDVEYRLAPPPRWDQAPADIICALSWVRSAPELAVVDSTKVVVVGESAGGSLALVASFAAATDGIPSSCAAADPPVVPAGVVALAPAADLAGIWEDATIHDNDGKRFPEAYIGGSPAEFPERYRAASPFRLFRATGPPTLVIAAESDRLVRLDRVTSIVDGIRAAGGYAELIVAPYAGHGFDGEPNSFGQQLTEVVIPDFVARITG